MGSCNRVPAWWSLEIVRRTGGRNQNQSSVLCIPVTARRIFRSRGVVALDKDPRRCSNLGKRLGHAGIARPCADRRWAKRTFLSIKLGVVDEVRGESTLHVQADGDFVEIPAANRFWKPKD